MRIDGARKGSAFVSEELAFEKAGGDRRAIHLHQTSVSAGAELVNRSSDDFLAGAGLAGDQNCRIRGCNRFHLSRGCRGDSHGDPTIVSTNGSSVAVLLYARVRSSLRYAMTFIGMLSCIFVNLHH